MANQNITLEMQIKAVERVLAKRHKLYPDFIEGAFEEYQAMEAVLETLKRLRLSVEDSAERGGGLFDNATEDQIAEAIDR